MMRDPDLIKRQILPTLKRDLTKFNRVRRKFDGTFDSVRSGFETLFNTVDGFGVEEDFEGTKHDLQPAKVFQAADRITNWANRREHAKGFGENTSKSEQGIAYFLEEFSREVGTLITCLEEDLSALKKQEQ